MKILFLVQNLNKGGTEVQVSMLTAEFKPLVIQLDEFIAGAIRWALVVKLFRLFILIVRIRPIVIQAFLPNANCIAALFGRIARVPLIVVSQRISCGYYVSGNRRALWKDRIAFRLAHIVVCNSEKVAIQIRRLHRLPWRKVMVILNACRFDV